MTIRQYENMSKLLATWTVCFCICNMVIIKQTCILSISLWRSNMLLGLFFI